MRFLSNKLLTALGRIFEKGNIIPGLKNISLADDLNNAHYQDWLKTLVNEMPKLTVKYRLACECANSLQIEVSENQETLYRVLNEQGWYWDSSIQEWKQFTEPADPPTELIRIRVWSDRSRVEGAAYQLRVAMEEQGYIFLEQSEPYACRPPKQLEYRVYLTFK